MLIPGVGKRWSDKLLNVRQHVGNITPEIFDSLRIIRSSEIANLIDFEPWYHSSEAESPNEGAEMGPSPDLESQSFMGPGQCQVRDKQSEQLLFRTQEDRDRQASMADLFEQPSARGMNMAETAGQREREHHAEYLRRMESASQKLSGPPSGYAPRSVNNFDRGYNMEWDHMKQEDSYMDRSDRRTSRPRVDRQPPSRQRDGQFQSRGSASIPRSISFDGKKDWRAFLTKFNMYADSQRWTTNERRQNLCWCLDDKASEFYSRLIERDQDLDYFEILDRMGRRFQLKELPETAQMYFSLAAQNPKESLVEWADRVVSLAMTAFPDMSDVQIYRQAILRFCQGCLDKRAGHYAINQRPMTMDDALDKVRWFQHTDKLMNERPRRDVRAVALPQWHADIGEYDDYDATGPQYSVARASMGMNRSEKQGERKVHFQQDSEKAKSIDNLETKINKMDDRISNIATSVEGLTEAIKKLRARSPSPRAKSPLRCYGCGREGHFKYDCPDIKQDSKKVASVGEDLEEDLNSSGSEH